MVVARLSGSIVTAALLLAGCAEETSGPAASRDPAPRASRVESAQDDMVALHGALVYFYVNHTRYPDRLENLTEEWAEGALGEWYVEELPLDPWGEPYLLGVEQGPPDEVWIKSTGPDRKEGTPDDVEDRRPTYVTGR